MADLGTLQVKIALNDSSFQQGISNLKQQLAVADSSFKASMNGSKDWGKSLDGLKAYADSLGQKIKAQSGIVDMYSQALEKSQTNLKNSSQKMAELKTKLDEAKTAFNEQSSSLDKNSIEYKTLKDNVDKAQKAYDQQEKAVIKNNKSMQGYQIQLNNSKAKLNELTGELKKANESIDKQNSTWAKLKEGIKSHAESIKTAIGAIGIATAAWLGKSISVAGTAEKTNADLAQTIKSTGGAAGLTAKQVSDMANKFSASTTYSAAMIKSGQNMLLTFTNIGKNVFPMATQAMLDMSTKMKTEPTQAAMQLGKALNDPIKGITALSRVGVSFSDSQKKVIKQMVSTGNTAGAQKIILQELNREFGGQATAAANTYEGSQQRLKNQLIAIQATIGNQLLPALLKIVSNVAPVIQQVIVFIQQNPKLVTGILGVVAVLGTLFGGMSAVNTVLGLFNIQLRMNQALITGGVMLAIIALVAGAVLIVKHWGQIKEKTTELINKFNEFKNSAIDKVKKSFQDLKNGVEGFGKSLVNVKNNAINSVKQKFDEFEATLKKNQMVIKVTAGILGTIFGPALIKTGIQATAAGTKIAAGFIANLVKTGAQATASGTKISASFIANMVKTGATAVVNGVKVSASFTASMIKSGAQAVTSGTKISVGFITSMVRASAQAIKTGAAITGNLIKAIVSYSAEGWKAVASIAKQTVAWAAQKIQVIASTIALGAHKIATVALTVATNGLTAAQNLLKIAFVSTPWGWVVLAIMGVVAAGIALYKNWDMVKKKANETWNGIRAAFAPLGNFARKMYGWGKDMINGFVSGIKAGFGAVGDAVEWVASKVSALLHHSKPDEGPMKDDDKWAPDFMKGFANGIENNKNLVTNAVKNLATDVSVGMKVIPAISGNNLTGSITSTNINSSRPPVQFIFKGNYCFMNKEMIDYFAKKVSNVIAYNSLGRR